jgi:hypothetical protein
MICEHFTNQSFETTGMDKPKKKSELELELISSNYSSRAGAGAF